LRAAPGLGVLLISLVGRIRDRAGLSSPQFFSPCILTACPGSGATQIHTTSRFQVSAGSPHVQISAPPRFVDHPSIPGSQDLDSPRLSGRSDLTPHQISPHPSFGRRAARAESQRKVTPVTVSLPFAILQLSALVCVSSSLRVVLFDRPMVHVITDTLLPSSGDPDIILERVVDCTSFGVQPSVVDVLRHDVQDLGHHMEWHVQHGGAGVCVCVCLLSTVTHCSSLHPIEPMQHTAAYYNIYNTLSQTATHWFGIFDSKTPRFRGIS